MTYRKRRFFFYALLLLFVVISPLIIAYAVGYTLNLRSGIFEQKGGIFMKSKTPRLSISLDGNFLETTSYFSGSALLTEIAKGAHLLRLEKPNYYPWTKQVTVDSSLVTDLRNIILIPKPVSLATTTADELIMIKRRLQQKTDALASEHAPYFLETNGSLKISTGTSTKIVATNIHSFGVIGKTIFFIDRSGFLARMDMPDYAIQTIGRPGFYLAKEKFRFFLSPLGGIFIIDSGGGLYSSDGITQIDSITGGTVSLAFDSRGEKLLIIKNNSVEYIWLQDNAYQPFQKRGTREVVFVSSTQITQAEWFFGDNAHVVIHDDDRVIIAEIDGRGGRYVVELLSGHIGDIVTMEELPQSIIIQRKQQYYKIDLY